MLPCCTCCETREHLLWLLTHMVSAQIIGVGAAVLGDMSSRPNWGLYELDFVFSTVVVRAIRYSPMI